VADESNLLDALVGQVEDESLKSRLAREIELLRGSRRFGLVFDPHLPESVRLPEHPVRKGVKVTRRDESQPDRAWRVSGFSDNMRTVAVLDGDGGEVPVADLVVIREFGEPVYPGLCPVGRLANGPADAPWNTVINGENFHVLQALRSTHREKVDLIYIDPPYNTGGKTSWLYNDRFVDKSDRAKSSKWLSFMERRLKIAQDLLKPTGAIFVSIGDDEQHRLRMLLDQVFGPENCVAVLTVEMSTTSGPKTTNAQQGTIVKNSEFVLIYRKGSGFDSVRHTPLVDAVDGWDANYSAWLYEDGRVGTLTAELLGRPDVRAEVEEYGLLDERGRFNVANMDILLRLSPATKAVIDANLDRVARRDRLPVSCREADPPVGEHIEFKAEDRTYTLTRLANGNVWQLIPLSRNYRMSDDYKPRFGRTVLRGDLWKGFHSDMAHVTEEGAVNFNNGKKPVRLIKQLIRWGNNAPDAVILDFFGGSGTTAHAVMAMNEEDGGRRQCVLVTNNEVSIDAAKALRGADRHPGDPEWEREGVFEAVTVPRITTVVTGKKPTGAPYGGPLSANVEFLRLTYLDPGTVRRGREFQAIAPLLWMRAGAVGERVDAIPESRWALTPSYGILFDIDALSPFAAAVSDSAIADAAPALVFVVTDSETEYQHAVERLPVGIETVQLYEDYLSNFTVNVEGGVR